MRTALTFAAGALTGALGIIGAILVAVNLLRESGADPDPERVE